MQNAITRRFAFSLNIPCSRVYLSLALSNVLLGSIPRLKKKKKSKKRERLAQRTLCSVRLRKQSFHRALPEPFPEIRKAV